MKTTTNIENKVISSFISEFGFTPKSVKIENEYAFADGFWCRIINNNVKKINKRSWRLDVEN